ncbi:MAG: YifB family Mg chelatase-like AAA ATPase [Anaerolineae bacterium]|nr:YifB family Mg chelatase-like AAA ATPase [Anaerolineae bacterium]
MLAKVNSCALVGLDGTPVDVEVDMARGMPSISVVGLPSAAVKESKDRVRAAIKNSGLRFPGQGRLTINLAPADLKKEGPAYDLPIALGVLAATGQIPTDELDNALILGELSLDGSLRHVRGVLSATHMAAELGYDRIYVPAVDAAEASLIPDIDIYPIDHLITLVEHLLGLDAIPTFDRVDIPSDERLAGYQADFADVKGQEHVKRALEIAAAGGHNVHMVGPPGAGKTLLARAVPGILPDMVLEEALEVTRIYSVADMLPEDVPLIRQRPFRAPHHTISHAGLVGGGTVPRPGEISLAHRGVLFLDELPEFGKNLETLRQPLEDRQVTISRASGTMCFPSNFMLIGASNPCPCGFYGDPVKACTCSSAMVTRYRQRISGPMLDRIDIHVEVPRVDFDKLTDDRRGEPSESVRKRVQAARDRQAERFARMDGSGRRLLNNADMGAREITSIAKLDSEGEKLIRSAMQQMNLSARAYHRVLKLSRTIADLDGSAEIRPQHLAEALQYRARG